MRTFNIIIISVRYNLYHCTVYQGGAQGISKQPFYLSSIHQCLLLPFSVNNCHCIVKVYI